MNSHHIFIFIVDADRKSKMHGCTRRCSIGLIFKNISPEPQACLNANVRESSQ